MFNANIELSSKNDTVIKTDDLDIRPNPKGLGYELFTSLKEHNGNIAQIDVQTGQNETYKDVLEKCITVALYLQNQGIKSEDIIASCTSNHFNTIIAAIAPIFIGAKTASISPLHSGNDIKSMIETIKPKLLLVNEESKDKIINGIEQELTSVTEIITIETILNPPANVEEIENFTPVEIQDLSETAILVFSSGKSDVPKAKCFSHYSVLCQTQRLTKSRTKNSNYLIYSGLDWIDTHANLITNILCGGKWFITSEFDPNKLQEQLNKYEINHLTLSVLDAIRFLRHWKSNKLNTPGLKSFTIFAKKLSAEIINDIQKLFSYPIQINNSYNLSEIYGPCFAPNNLKPDSVGVPMNGFTYKIVHPNTNKLCGPYKKGEICIKSKFCMSYCYDDSTDFFDPDGFLRTGDLGYYDDERNFFIIDPLNEILTFNTHISPTALAQILYQHPAVKIAGIFGVPSNVGDIVTGVVVKSEKYPDISEGELIKFVNDRVEDFEKISGGIMFVEESMVPFTPTGKVRRYILQQAIFEDFDNLDMTIDFT